MLLHYDGSAWHLLRSFTDRLWTIGGTPSDLWLGGEAVVWHFDGLSWEASALSGYCIEIAVVAPEDVYCAGYDSERQFLVHYRQGVWDLESIVAEHITVVGDSVYATGWDGVQRYVWRRQDQGPWSQLTAPGDTWTGTIGADDDGHVFLAGDDGALYFLRNDHWYVVWTGTRLSYNGLVGLGGELFVLAGWYATLMHGH